MSEDMQHLIQQNSEAQHITSQGFLLLWVGCRFADNEIKPRKGPSNTRPALGAAAPGM
jgi:hypothetical protein